MPAPDSSEGRELERSFTIVAWVVLGLTLAKGFRPPGRWGATHFAFNYSQGFVRRGLVGEIARRIGGDDVYRYNTYAISSLAVVLLSIVAMAWSVRRVLKREPADLGFRVALLAFLASPAVFFLSHIVGYFDWIGLALLLVFLAGAAHSKRRFALYYWATAIGAFLTFVHEGLIPMFLPAIGFIMLCHIARQASSRAMTKWGWAAQLAHAVLSCSSVMVPSVILSISGTDQVPRVRAMQSFIERHADYALRPDAVETLTRSAHQNMTELLPWFWSQDRFWRPMIYGQISFIPGFLFILFFGCYAIWRSALPRWQRWVLCPAFVVASLTPELMNYVGWDWMRWNSISMASAITCIVALRLFVPTAKPSRLLPWLVPTGLSLTVIGLASTTMLFDSFTAQLFPFQQHVEFIEQLVKGGYTHRPAL